jgi:hypothetical protein
MLISEKVYDLLYEGRFDTISSFLLNPENRDIEWNQLIAEFEADGGKVLGSGIAAQAFFHPNWDYVLKTYSYDSCYTRYVRLAMNPPFKSSAFPIFYDKPRRVIPQFTRHHSMERIYVVRMEKLINEDKSLFFRLEDVVNEKKQFFPLYKDIIEFGLEKALQYSRNQELLDQFELHIPIRNNELDFAILSHYLISNESNIIPSQYCEFDLHYDNVMQRENGDWVIIDPYIGEEDGNINNKRRDDIAGYNGYNATRKIEGGKRLKNYRNSYKI